MLNTCQPEILFPSHILDRNQTISMSLQIHEIPSTPKILRNFFLHLNINIKQLFLNIKCASRGDLGNNNSNNNYSDNKNKNNNNTNNHKYNNNKNNNNKITNTTITITTKK